MDLCLLPLLYRVDCLSFLTSLCLVGCMSPSQARLVGCMMRLFAHGSGAGSTDAKVVVWLALRKQKIPRFLQAWLGGCTTGAFSRLGMSKVCRVGKV
jgi:hypothetical protein